MIHNNIGIYDIYTKDMNMTLWVNLLRSNNTHINLIGGDSYDPAIGPVTPTSTPTLTPTSTPATQYKPRYYFQPPPFIETTLTYQNVNADPILQSKVTNYFLNKTIKWIHTKKSFKSCKKYLNLLNNENTGYDIIHKILKILVRKGNTNWYDLKSQEYIVKDYILHKLK